VIPEFLFLLSRECSQFQEDAVVIPLEKPTDQLLHHCQQLKYVFRLHFPFLFRFWLASCPIVSIEWLIQCLICQSLVPLDASPLFSAETIT
jgi:hypothetical protein